MEVFGSCGLQEESPQRWKITRRFTRLQLDRIGCHRGLMKSSLSRLLRLGMTMSRRSSGGSIYIAGDEGQRYGPEVFFSRGGVSPPRLKHEEALTAALVATFLVNYDRYKKTVRREAGDDFMRGPAELSELVDLVHQDALMRYFDGVGNLTDAQIRTGLEKVARVKRVAGEADVSEIRNDLRQELTMGDKLALCDNVAMVTGNLRRYLQKKNLTYELCPGEAWKRGADKMVVQLLLQGVKPAHFRDAVKLQLSCIYACMYVWSSHIAEYGSTG